MNTMNAKKVDNEFVSKKGNVEFKTDAKLDMGFAPGMLKKVKKTMRPAKTNDMS